MRFFAALGFLTAIPIPLRRAFSPVEIGRSIAYFPVVGLMLGLILVGLDVMLDRVLPSLVANTLLLAALVALTGALHLDGWMDCCDALLGFKSPEARLRILREPQIGAFGVAGAVLLLLVKFAALASLTGSARSIALLLAPTCSRWGMAYAIIAYPYARGASGKGSAFKEHARRIDLLIATLVALAIAIVSANVWGIVLIGIAWLVTIGMARFAIVRISGLTGDVYCTINEMIEVTLWLILTIH